MPRPVARLLTLGVGVAAFVIIAGAIQPFSTDAENAGGNELANGPVAWSTMGSGDKATVAIAGTGMSLGQFVGADYRVIITSAPDGPRYTVQTLSGRLLQEGLGLAEVRRAFPTLDLEKAIVDPEAKQGTDGALMIADSPGPGQ